ncbi:HET-domain-containing protein [Lentinus brumalis]|uniref:HET-domain-containing protein n=1 Tax=Lentinus brumalis TaxID=2498619 RepID=A0A371CLE5_9APHY|nr:HET-domain-containing protein [Polyporus brumalis]
MRLIVTDTGQFVEINDPAKHIYAILSHTWDWEGEQSFREVREIQHGGGIPLILPESALDEEFYTRIIPSSEPPSRSTSLRGESALNEESASNVIPPSEHPSRSASPETHAPNSSWKNVRTAVACWRKKMQRSLAHAVKALSHRARPLSNPTPSTLDASGSTKRILASFDLSSDVPTRPSILDHAGLSQKIKGACAVAREYGYRLLWIDSCCIEKESSAELSEAINSMFNWYRCATVCFAFIPHLPLNLVGTSYDTVDSELVVGSLRRNCRWFMRGWTLQELIAPREVVFLGKGWRFVGNKSELVYLLAAVTGIEAEILTHQKRLDEVSVADRMGWASGRKTTRAEDRAYCLFGIFSINLPIIYGEGDHAFLRLQKEILQTIPDQRLFIWSRHSFRSLYSADSVLSSDGFAGLRQDARLTASPESGLLADSPDVFLPEGRNLYIRYYGPGRVVSTFRAVPPRSLARRLGIPELHPSYAITAHGVHTDLPLIRLADILSFDVHQELGKSEEAYLAVLACEATQYPNSLVAMLCTIRDDVQKMGDGSARKSVSKSLLCEPGDRTSRSRSFVILPSALVERVRNGPELLRVSQVSIPLTSAESSFELPKLSHIPDFIPACRGPQLQNRRVLEESGYVVTVTSRTYIPSPTSTYNQHASVVFVRLSRDAFSVQVRLVAFFFWGKGRWQSRRDYIVMVTVGKNLTSGDPYSESPEGESEPLATFTFIDHSFDTTESDAALHEVRVPFHGTSGPEVTLRIILTEHYPLRTYLLHLDVLGFEVARRDYYKSQVPERDVDSADTSGTASWEPLRLLSFYRY